MQVSRPLWRRPANAATIVLAVGIAAWAWHRQPAAAQIADRCPNLLDAAAIALARLAPGAPFGIWLARAHAGLLVPALAIATLSFAAAGRSLTLAAAAGLALAAQPILNPSLAPFDPLALIVAAAAALALFDAADGTSGRWRPTIAALTASALVQPRATLLLAVAAGAVVFLGDRSRPANVRWRRAALAVLAPIACSVAVQWITPDLPASAGVVTPLSCLVPVKTGLVQAIVASLRTALAPGPYMFALAALGAFVAWRLDRPRMWRVLVYVAAMLMGLPESVDASLRRDAATIIMFWSLTTIGLAEAVRACRSSTAGRAAAALIVLLLPLFQVPRLFDRPVPESSALEHLSWRDARQVVALLPSRAVLVSDDALSTTLLRSVRGAWLRMGKRIEIVTRSTLIRSSATMNPQVPIYALPPAQLDLQLGGLRLQPAQLGPVSGIAEVRAGAPCTVARQRWQDLDLLDATALSFAPDEPDAAVVIYAPTSRAPVPERMKWPEAIRDGFEWHSYDLSIDAERSQLAQDAAADELPGDRLPQAPFVLRLRLWRPPAAPSVLGVRMGTPVGIALMRTMTPSRVRICGVFPSPVEPIQVGR
jgi:hypothetical protein